MKIKASQSTLKRYVGLAFGFTDSGVGSQYAHRRCLLITVNKKGTATITAENEQTAIEFALPESADLEVKGSGQILVDARRLNVIINTIQPDAEITLSLDKDERHLIVQAGKFESQIALVPITSGRVLLPTVGEYNDDSVLEIESQELLDAISAGSVAYDTTGTVPSLSTIWLYATASHLFLTSCSKIKFAYFAAKLDANTFVPTVKKKKDKKSDVVERPTDIANKGAFDVLLEPDLLLGLYEQFSNSDIVKIYLDSTERVHFVCVTEGDKKPGREIHVRVAQSATIEPHQYPARDMEQKITSKVAYMQYLSIDKLEFLQMMRSAATIVGLNTGIGQDKPLRITIDKGAVKVHTDEKDTSDVVLNDEIGVKSYTGDKLEFVLRWGIYSKVFESYPSKDDLHVAVVYNQTQGGDVPRALIFYKDADWEYNPKDSKLPADYLATIPIKPE